MSFVFSLARQDLILQFESAAISAAASVEHMSSSAASLAAAVKRIANGRIAIAETMDLPVDLFSELRKMSGVTSGRSKQERAACDVGITEAFAGVARTGSACVAVDHDHSGTTWRTRSEAFVKEWKGSGTRTKWLVAFSLFVLVASTVIVGYGNYLGVASASATH